MMLRAFFAIAIIVQLRFFVRGNCTTELSMPDDAEMTSLENETLEDGWNSTRRDNPDNETAQTKRSIQGENGVGVIENSTTSTNESASTSQGSPQNSSLEIDKGLAETSILDGVSSSSLDKLLIPKTMIDLGEIAVHKNSDIVDIDADKFDIEGHMTTASNSGEISNNKPSSTPDGMPNTTSGIVELSENGFPNDNDQFDDGDHMTPGIIVDFREESKEKTSSNVANITDSDYEINVKVENGKRLKRNTNSDESFGEPINQPGDNISTSQANASESQNVEGTDTPTSSLSVDPILRRLLKQQGMQNVNNDSAVAAQDANSTSSDVQSNETTSTASTNVQPDETTTQKRKLKRLPSLQYLAHRAVTDIDGEFSPHHNRRYKRSHVYSLKPEDVPESLKNSRNKKWRKPSNRKHYHKI